LAVPACDGSGACVTTNATCGNFKCVAAAGTTPARCPTVCASDNDCLAPNACVGGKCGLQPAGGPCSATNQCATGLTCDTREGVCCNSACSGVCETCRATNSVGTCTVLPNG